MTQPPTPSPDPQPPAPDPHFAAGGRTWYNKARLYLTGAAYLVGRGLAPPMKFARLWAVGGLALAVLAACDSPPAGAPATPTVPPATATPLIVPTLPPTAPATPTVE